MKKLIFVLSFLLPIIVFGQNWSPAGAIWHFGFSEWVINGYYKIEYVSDTTIASTQCKKLKKTRYEYSLVNSAYDTIEVGSEYTYADSNKVYIFKHNQFYTLYDFSAQVGSTWIVPETEHYNGCDTIGTVQVDSIGTLIIDGQNLRYICVSIADVTPKWGWKAKIVERIGPIKSYDTNSYDYLFPVKFDGCGIFPDQLIEGGSFRCYSDSTFGYSLDTIPTCEYISTSINEINKTINRLVVFPNPANNKIAVDFNGTSKDVLLEIKNTLGETVYSEKTQTLTSKTIDISGYSNGVYFLHLQSAAGVISKKFVKQ